MKEQKSTRWEFLYLAEWLLTLTEVLILSYINPQFHFSSNKQQEFKELLWNHVNSVLCFFLNSTLIIHTDFFSDQEVAGKVTLKHVYEIAKIKQQDPPLSFLPLETICKQILGIAQSCGIKVVHKLDAQEYAEYLKERKLVVEEELKELQAKKEARMLRTG